MPNYESRESYGEVSVSQIYIPIVPNRAPTYRIRPAQAVEKFFPSVIYESRNETEIPSVWWHVFCESLVNLLWGELISISHRIRNLICIRKRLKRASSSRNVETSILSVNNPPVGPDDYLMLLVVTSWVDLGLHKFFFFV